MSGYEGISIDMSQLPKPDGYDEESEDFKRGYMEAVILMVIHGVPVPVELDPGDMPQELLDAAAEADEDDIIH